MLTQTVVAEIRRLLAEDELSHRKIALVTGVCRGTIGAIAAGKRPDYQQLRRTRQGEPLEPAGPPERCPGCGGMVYHPCRFCQARSLAALSRKPATGRRQEPPGELLTLQLKEEHRRRYEEIHARRLEEQRNDGMGRVGVMAGLELRT
jgi:hypothetical protein